MSDIPYMPDSPPVVGKLEKMPTGILQAYAKGQPRQPTGQVTPGPFGAAAKVLDERNAKSAANQRQMAMNNNPAQSPTTFQQLQAKEQALAAKEKQLGVLGALLAQRAAPQLNGVSGLPISDNMFTAMDGGIVFSGGGGVKGYNGRDGESQIDVEKLPRFDPLQPSREPSERAKRALAGLGSLIGQDLVEAAIARRKQNAQVESPKEEKKEDTGRKESGKTTAPSGVAGLDIEGRIRRGLASVRGESDEQQRLASDYQAKLNEQYDAIDKSNMTDEQKEAARKKVTDAMQAEYSEYTKGREERQQKVAEAMRGKKPGLFAGIASALPSGNASVADVLAGAAKGVTAERGRYRDADKEAALYMARAQEESAKADMLEKRGQRAEAQAAEDRAQMLMDKAATRKMQALGIQKEGIAALLSREDKKQDYERAIAEKAVMGQLDYDTKVQLERLRASLQPREVSFYNQLLAAFNSGDPKRIASAKDMLAAMNESKRDPNRGNVTESQLRKAYDAAMLKWGTTIDTLNKPKPTYEEWKASSAGKSAGAETLDFTGGLK